MDRESVRGFQYHAGLPYTTESSEEALAELQLIVSKLLHLYDTDQFQKYEFGSAYAYDAGMATRELLAWQKRKLDIPLETKVQLTKMYLNACFDAVEPTLMVRYGTACLSLWKGSTARLQLRKIRNVIDWKRLVRVVRNVVILPAIKSSNLGKNGGVDGLGSLSGVSSGGSSFSGSLSSMSKSSSQLGVALSLASLFRCTVEMDENTLPLLNDEILSFLGPHGHDPAPHVIIEAFTALIPYNDPKAAEVFVPMLFDLWKDLTPNVAAVCLIPAVAEFAEQVARNDTSFSFSNEHLDTCFQAVLHSLQIPLISAQKSKSIGSGKARNTTGGGLSGDSDKSARYNRSTVNLKPFGTYSGAFAKLVVWSLTSDDQRSLDLLDSLVNAVLSFCHPSNVGPWTVLIFTALMDIAYTYVQRVNLEDEFEITAHRRLTSSLTERLTEILKHPVVMGIHSQAPYVFATALETLRNISLLTPGSVIPALLGEIYPTLQHGLHQPHRLITSLACLSRIAVPMVSKPQYKMHLTTLLELTLTNIDANESKRCLLTLALFQAVASVTVFVDESDDTSIALASQCLPECVHSLEDGNVQPSEVTDDENLAENICKGTSAAYPEILQLYMRRVFELLETTTEHRLGSAASASVLRVLLACSPAIYDRLLNITLEEILNPQQLSHDAFAQVCGSFVRANCKASFGVIWQLLSRNIREEIIENQAGSGRTIMPKDNSLLRYLSVLNMSLLAANSECLVEIADDLRDLLLLLREKTNVCVVYTVANTLHHAIAGLVGHSVILPNPLGESPVAANQVSVKSLSYLNLHWNVPTPRSEELAIQLFKDHIDISQSEVSKSISGASKNVSDEDAVSNALIFTRTATGAISVVCGPNTMNRVGEYRKKVLELITDIYQRLSRDDILGLKEVLFVAKVWLCDVGYERTARLDSHQDTLYQYEKRSFQIGGAHKHGLPPAVLARRAQLYHHQRLALQTQYRDLDDESRSLILDVIVDACFSAYPAVRRNAFSALYSPLKIFSNQELYEKVYSRVLDNITEFLQNKEYERASGGFSLLKYRSFGILTVGNFPKLLKNFVKVVSESAAADHRQLSNLANYTFFLLVPDTFRIGINKENNDSMSVINDLLSDLSSESFASLHWREALFRATALQVFAQSPKFPLNADVMKLFLEGSLLHHPDLRTTSILGALGMMQKSFRLGIVGYDFDNYSTDGEIELPAGAFQSQDSTAYENDWSLFFMPAPLSIAKAWKTHPRPAPKHIKVGSQGWRFIPKKQGLWRAPTLPSKGLNRLCSGDADELQKVMQQINTSEYWQKLFDLHRVEPRMEDDKMLRQIALMFRNLVIFGDYGYHGPNESLETLLSVDELENASNWTDKNWHRIAAEMVCGLMLATPLVTEKGNALIIEKILGIFKIALKYVSPETVNYWNSALVFAFSNVDHRRLSPIIELLEASADPETSSDGGGFKLSLRMELYTETLATIRWHRPSFESSVKNWPKWNHSLQTTRESCGDEISIAATTIQRISDTEMKELVKLFDLDVPKIELSLLHLLLRLLQMLGGDTCLDLLVSKGIPFLLKCSAVRDDPEVVVIVTNVFSEFAGCTFSTASLRTVSQTVIESIRSAQWHQRIRMLLFLQSFFFNHLLALDGETRETLAMVTVDTLADSQTEVRELAADTLSGIIRCSPAEEQRQYVQTLISKFGKLIGLKTPLVERHAAVLGLGALIGAFPYNSPPSQWIPGLLASLAVKAAGDSGIVGKSAKQVLGDFKKTRQDTWHIDQTVFSQDQLDDLDGVLWKNYFA